MGVRNERYSWFEQARPVHRFRLFEHDAGDYLVIQMPTDKCFNAFHRREIGRRGAKRATVCVSTGRGRLGLHEPLWRCAVVIGVGFLTGLPAQADDVPAARAELVVPAEQAQLGKVFYVVPGKSTIQFTSKTRKESFKGKVGEVAGYVVLSDADAPLTLVAGEFRVSVASIKTGNPSRDEHLQTKRWLQAATHPEIIFEMTPSEATKVIRERKKYTLFGTTLKGKMKIAGGVNPVSIDARIRLKPDDGKKRKKPRGDVMKIVCEFPVALADYGIGGEDSGKAATRIASEMAVKVSLTLSTIAPPGRSG